MILLGSSYILETLNLLGSFKFLFFSTTQRRTKEESRTEGRTT